MTVSYTIFIFICSYIFDYLLDSVMPWHLFCVPYSLTNNLCHSILCPLSTFHPPSPHHSITPRSYLPPSIYLTTCPVFRLLTHFPLVLFLPLSSQHPFITPCLPILTVTTYHSVPCDSVSHFLRSPYYLFTILLQAL